MGSGIAMTIHKNSTLSVTFSVTFSRPSNNTGGTANENKISERLEDLKSDIIYEFFTSQVSFDLYQN